MENRKTIAIVGLILGIVTFICSYIPYASFAAIITGIVGIILCAKARKALRANNEKVVLPTIGLVLSIVGLVCAVIMSIVYTCTIILAAGVEAAYEADPDGFTSTLEAVGSELENELSSLSSLS